MLFNYPARAIILWSILVISQVHLLVAQPFAAPLTNPFNLPPYAEGNVYIPRFADLDADGDLDLITGQLLDGIVYYENIGTAENPLFAEGINGAFGMEVETIFTPILSFTDIDDDGDIDLFAGDSAANDDLLFLENIGSPESPDFALPVLNPFNLIQEYNSSFYHRCVDLDDDSDFDVLAGIGGAFVFYENTGTPETPNFAPELTPPFELNTTGNEGFMFPAFADFDEDEDLDLLVGQYFGVIKLYENIGTPESPSFAPPTENPYDVFAVNPNSFVIPELVDLDNDGDADLITSEYFEDKGGILYYHENLRISTAVSILPEDLKLDIYPNLVKDACHLQANYPIEQVEIINLGGQVLQTYSGEISRLDFKNLPSGLYQVKVQLKGGSHVTKSVVKI